MNKTSNLENSDEARIDKPKRSLRWPRPQVSLATLLTCMALLGCVLALYRVTQRNAEVAKMLNHFDAYIVYESTSNPGEIPTLRDIPKWKTRLLGKEYFYEMSRFEVNGNKTDLDEFWSQIQKHRAAFSGIEFVGVHNVDLVDEQIIKQLKWIPIKFICFDDCEFTNGALKELSSFSTLEAILIENCKRPTKFDLLLGRPNLIEVGFMNCDVDLEFAERMRATATNTHIYSLKREH